MLQFVFGFGCLFVLTGRGGMEVRVGVRMFLFYGGGGFGASGSGSGSAFYRGWRRLGGSGSAAWGGGGGGRLEGSRLGLGWAIFVFLSRGGGASAVPARVRGGLVMLT